jgi:seryl-tRNA synthetase
VDRREIQGNQVNKVFFVCSVSELLTRELDRLQALRDEVEQRIREQAKRDAKDKQYVPADVEDTART